MNPSPTHIVLHMASAVAGSIAQPASTPTAPQAMTSAYPRYHTEP